MSRQNKVNKDSYVQAGRLTPDEIARERRQNIEKNLQVTTERVRGRAARVKGRERPGGERGASRPRSAPEE